MNVNYTYHVSYIFPNYPDWHGESNVYFTIPMSINDLEVVRKEIENRNPKMGKPVFISIYKFERMEDG